MRIRLTAAFLMTSSLNESKRNFLAKQFKLKPEIVEEIAQFDPSPNNAYTAWLCRAYKEVGDIASLSKFSEPLKKFMKLMNSPEFPKEKRDIGKYTTEELLELVGNDRRLRRNLSEREVEREIMTKGLPGAKLIWDGGGFKMWAVTNAKYARFLSSNTSWCTAQPDYSTNYCNRGTLYPIYHLGKPYIQGFIEHNGTGIEFLDVRDSQVSFKDPVVLEMFDTIRLPQLVSFCKAKLDKNQVGYIVEDSDVPEEALGALKKLLIDTGNIPGIAGFCSGDCESIWEDGFEILLDYPQILFRTVKDMSIKKLTKLAEINPELAHDVTSEIMTADWNRDRYLPAIIIALMGEKFGMKFVPELVEKAMQSGMTIPEVVRDNSAYMAEAVKIVSQKIREATERDGNMIDFFNNNYSLPELKPCILEYCKKFIRR
jgi:hypothetical protein